MAPKKAPKAQQAEPVQAEQAPKEQAEQVKAPKEKKPKAKPAQAKPAQAKEKEQEQALAEQTQAQAKQEQPAMQAVSIVLIETNGTIKTLKTKEVSLDTLYKKCGFRVNDDFLCRHTWSLTLKGTKEKYKVSLWGKKTGKANFENKYDLPPPLDKELFFGTCALVRTSSEGTGSNASEAGASSEGTLLDLTKETWLKIYEQLFGGFEDIGDEDEYSEDELENVDPALLTKDGYLKDDFVVSDKEAISAATSTNASEADDDADETASACETASEAEEDEAGASACETASEAEDEETYIKKKPVKKVVKKGGKKVKEEEIDDTSELEEEVYTFSDDDD
jgi:hypothetical protein